MPAPVPSSVIIQAWPAKMTARTAAAYLDFGTKDPAGAFRAAVRRGLYPQPVHLPGEPPKWRKIDLDAAVEGRNDNKLGGWEVAS